MTDEEKHAFCRRLGFPHAVFLPPLLYKYTEQSGQDMAFYVMQKRIPESPYHEIEEG